MFYVFISIALSCAVFNLCLNASRIKGFKVRNEIRRERNLLSKFKTYDSFYGRKSGEKEIYYLIRKEGETKKIVLI